MTPPTVKLTPPSLERPYVREHDPLLPAPPIRMMSGFVGWIAIGLSYQHCPPQNPALPQPVRPFPSGLAGELLFQSDREGPTRLYVLDLASGKKIWEFEAGVGITASPAVANGMVFVGADDGYVYAFKS